VRCVRTEGADHALGEWADGRLASVRGIRAGARQSGFTVITEKQVIVTRTSSYAYRELLKHIVLMLQTGQSPVSGEELIEAVAFQDAANLSMERGGSSVELAEVGLPARMA
jgi:hypothetical protein